MQETQDSRIPDDRRYTNEHIWIRRDGGAFVCGITDFAQEQLDEVFTWACPRRAALSPPAKASARWSP